MSHARTVAEAAEQLGVTRKHARVVLKPFLFDVSIGRRRACYRILQSDIDKFIESRRVRAPASRRRRQERRPRVYEYF